MDYLHSMVMHSPTTRTVEQVLSYSEPVTQLLKPYVGELFAPIPGVMIMFYAPIFLVAALFFGAMGEKGFGRMEMTGCVPSFVHGCITVLACSMQVYQHFMGGVGSLDVDNAPAQVAVMQFSCAYFLSDVVLYLAPFARHEVLFALHHFAVMSYMMLAMYLGYGGMSAVAMIAIGEVTSPLQNVWFIIKNLRYSRQWADHLFAYVSWIYAAFYVFIRSFLAPTVIVAAAYSLFKSTRLPIGVKTYWLVCLFGVLFGSQIWSYNVSKRLFTAYKPQFGKKKIL